MDLGWREGAGEPIDTGGGRGGARCRIGDRRDEELRASINHSLRRCGVVDAAGADRKGWMARAQGGDRGGYCGFGPFATQEEFKC